MVRRLLVLIGAWILASEAPVRAQPAPWQVGVSDEQKAAAQAELERGNTLYIENQYEEALAAYRRGLAAWKHPSIQFNIAATLIALDRPVEAIVELEQAMQYGEKPLKDQWREALNYKTLLDRQVGTITLSCREPTELTLDTNTTIPCPGQTSTRVRAGEHVLLAQRPGYLTVRRKIVAIGGQDVTETIELVALKDAAVTGTRWATWKPWAVAGAGAAVAALGLLVDLRARSLYDDYAQALRDNCGDRACDPRDPDSRVPTDLLDRARFTEQAGLGIAAVGGIAVVVGVTLVVLNRPYTEVPTERTLVVSPTATGSGAVVGLGGSW